MQVVMTIQVYYKNGRVFKTEAAPSMVSPDVLRGYAALVGADFCTCVAAYGTAQFYAKDWKGRYAMRHSIYIETPFGDFQLARTDLSKGNSCSQCALLDSGHCHEVDCAKFDTERHHFHLVRRFVKKGGRNYEK